MPMTPPVLSLARTRRIKSLTARKFHMAGWYWIQQPIKYLSGPSTLVVASSVLKLARATLCGVRGSIAATKVPYEREYFRSCFSHRVGFFAS